MADSVLIQKIGNVQLAGYTVDMCVAAGRDTAPEGESWVSL